MNTIVEVVVCVIISKIALYNAEKIRKIWRLCEQCRLPLRVTYVFSLRFWSLLEPHCECHIMDGLPLVTTFCRGFGHQVAVDGKVLSYFTLIAIIIELILAGGA